MAVTISSPQRGFDNLIDQIDGFEDSDFLEEVAREMGHEVDQLIQDGFQSATDPYGIPWAPRKLAYGRRAPPHLPLNLTGATKGSFHVEPSSNGLVVSSPIVYSSFLQDGTRFMDARPMLPNGEDLGTWEAPLTDAAQRVFNRHLNRP